MKKYYIISIFSYIIIFTSYSINAQISIQDLDGRVNTITSAVPFLMITPDSRAGGLGDMGVASSSDANSQHWNAAKYSFIKEDFGISISYTPWLRALIGDMDLSYLTAYRKFKKGRAIGFGLRYFSIGSIQFTNFEGIELKK